MRTIVIICFLALLVWQALAEDDVQGGYETSEKGGIETFRTTGSEEHPCLDHECKPGYECDLDEDGNPTCVCLRKCPTIPGDHRVKVCSTQNVTFDTECEFDRQRCLCSTNHPECVDTQTRNALLDYYGPCKELTPCEDRELKEFPGRMRNWLFLVMEELDRRSDLTRGASKLLAEARTHTHRWAIPVIWKFCDLDATNDHYINWRELKPITAPLKPMEHCTGRFLEKCDVNNDGQIVLEEWGDCLGLEPEEIEDRCADLRDE